MVRAPEYAPLLGHREHILGELRPISDLSATIPVTVVSKDGVPYTYDFTVQRQVGGPWDGCYMTSMVTRADLHPRTR